MRTVEDESGRRYLLLKESSDASLLRDVMTGEERYVKTSRLTDIAGSGVLETAANTLSEPVRRLITAVHDERGIGVLVTLEATGPLPTRTLLDQTDLCESDLHGQIAEFQAAGVVEEITVDGERGYRVTAPTAALIRRLRSLDPVT